MSNAPTKQHATKPATRPATKPATKPATRPATKPATKQVTPIHGIRVVVFGAADIVVLIAGERYVGRFLLLPATLHKGDQVWLRIERALNRPQRAMKNGVDLAARVTSVLPRADGVVPETLRPGVRVLIMVETFGRCGCADDPTRARRFGAAGSGQDVGDASGSDVFQTMRSHHFHNASTTAVESTGLSGSRVSIVAAGVDDDATCEETQRESLDFDMLLHAAAGLGH